MLATQPVVDASRPSFEVGEDLVDPRQDEVSGGVPDDMDIVAIGGDRSVAGPAVGFRDGVGSGLRRSVRGRRRRRSEFRPAAGGLGCFRPRVRWRRRCASWLRPCPPVGGSSLVRNGRRTRRFPPGPTTGCARGECWRAACGRAAKRCGKSRYRAVSGAAGQRCRCVSPSLGGPEPDGERQLAGIVPAVTEVCRRQPAHSKVCAFLRSAHPFSWPHAGQTKPSGQRISQPGGAGVIVRDMCWWRGGCRGPVSCGGSVGRNV